MNYAIISDGLVVNAATADPEFAASQNWVELPEGAGIGWLYDGETFSPPPSPPPAVPSVVSMRQARLALLGAGLLSQVDAAINDMDEPDKSAARIEWEYATELRRDHPLVAGLAEELELTEQQVDALFVAASQIG